MKAKYQPYTLEFKRPGGTSRGVLHSKLSYFIFLEEGEKFGVGECGLLKGLSTDDVPEYETVLKEACRDLQSGAADFHHHLEAFPSIRFGLEQALLSLRSQDPFVLHPSYFTAGKASIPINGLIWMGEEKYLYDQLQEKIRSGFKCIKMKVGALDFDTEVRFLKELRARYNEGEIEVRLDANGAFDPAEALEKIKLLAQFGIHSIEQPIAQGQWTAMAQLCRKSPIPIVLDEELIGIFTEKDKTELLNTINPQYIILKPSLVGGYRASEDWIRLARKRRIGWWITSALESNIGLNAIAQWTFTLGNQMYQGLGTGSLYTNNFESPLEIQKGMLSYRPGLGWPDGLIRKLCS